MSLLHTHHHHRFHIDSLAAAHHLLSHITFFPIDITVYLVLHIENMKTAMCQMPPINVIDQ